jgi:hypothetical protein
MAKLTSTVELIYDARHQRKSIIEIEITNWSERSGIFTAEITDFYFKPFSFVDDNGVLQTVSQRIQHSSRPINVPASQVALLSDMIAPMIPNGTPEPVRREIEKQYGLLHIVQNDFVDEAQTKCVYFTNPNEWTIC